MNSRRKFEKWDIAITTLEPNINTMLIAIGSPICIAFRDFFFLKKIVNNFHKLTSRCLMQCQVKKGTTMLIQRIICLP